MLDGDQVVRVAPGDQVLGVGSLGVQGVSGDHRPGQVNTVQHGGEHRDLVGLGLNADLAQDHAMSVIKRGRCRPGSSAVPDPRSVLPSTAIIRLPPAAGAVRCWAQLPAASSRASASRCCKVRRNVDSQGTAPVTPSASRVPWSVSAAHSAIAVNDRAPASTAHTARLKMTASR